MDDRHLKNSSMDIRYLNPDFIGEEQRIMKVEIKILQKMVAQLTDKVQKQETEIDALKKLNTELTCNKDFNGVQDPPYSQNEQNIQTVQIPSNDQNVNDIQSSDGAPNFQNPQNSKSPQNTKNTKNSKNTQDTKNSKNTQNTKNVQNK